jgi:hypothetical protein
MKRTTALYLLLNIAGILLFVWFVYRIEAQAHAEERHYRDAVDGVTFFTTAVPVFLACVVLGFAWVIKVFIDVARKRGFESLKVLIAVACVWVVVIASMRFLPS